MQMGAQDNYSGLSASARQSITYIMLDLVDLEVGMSTPQLVPSAHHAFLIGFHLSPSLLQLSPCLHRC